MNNDQKVINTDDQPIQIFVAKSARGQYSWRVSIKGDKTQDIIKEIDTIHKTLEAKYGNHDKK